MVLHKLIHGVLAVVPQECVAVGLDYRVMHQHTLENKLVCPADKEFADV
jgi:hypothetical protein